MFVLINGMWKGQELSSWYISKHQSPVNSSYEQQKIGSGMGKYQVQYSYTHISIQVLLHLHYFSFYF